MTDPHPAPGQRRRSRRDRGAPRRRGPHRPSRRRRGRGGRRDGISGLGHRRPAAAVIAAVHRVLGAAAVVATLAAAACAPRRRGPPGRPRRPRSGAGRWTRPAARSCVTCPVPASMAPSGSAVVVGGGTYRFPGWSQNVDPSGRLTGTVPADAGAVEIVDPSDLLDRGTGSFVVTLRLRSDLTAQGRPARGARRVVQHRPEGLAPTIPAASGSSSSPGAGRPPAGCAGCSPTDGGPRS